LVTIAKKFTLKFSLEQSEPKRVGSCKVGHERLTAELAPEKVPAPVKVSMWKVEKVS